MELYVFLSARNGISVHENPLLDVNFMSLAHLEVEIWQNPFWGPEGASGGPKRGFRGSKNLTPPFFAFLGPKWPYICKQLNLSIKIERNYIL